MDPEPGLEFSHFSDHHLLFGISVLVVLLFFSGLISAAETAFFSLTEKDVKKICKDNAGKGKIINGLFEEPKKLSATLLIARTFTNIVFTLLFFIITNQAFDAIGSSTFEFILEIICIAVLILLFGEGIPKYFAARNAIKFAEFIAHPLYITDKLLSPISVPMRTAGLLNGRSNRSKSETLIDQLPQALASASPEATSNEEQKILEGIVSFGNTDTKQVMTPRIDIFALDIAEPFSEVYPKIIESGYSRIPVYRDNIDHITGVLFVKDLLPHINGKDCEWQQMIKEPFFVPESKKLEKLLTDFQGRKSHLAIVVDEYGGTSGVISLEDIIEEIVGDISDESDDDDIGYAQIDEKNFTFDGKIGLKDFYRIIDVDEALFEDKKGEAETLAGFILEFLGAFPETGQKIHFGKLLFTIEQLDNKRIKQIKVTIE
ncbi:MAG TPA: gliding motility-associated protein GldE [Flavobacterium sp.]|nr:gliding motility-associated protein GldE [Flavobacterium sp.]